MNYAPRKSCKVYTDTRLAQAIVDAVHSDEFKRWLEPSFGTGVFLNEVRNSGVAKRFVFGVDLSRLKASNDSLAVVTRGVDFIQWSQRKRKKFDCVVGNPPYVPINCLPEEYREMASEVSIDNRPIGVTANLWLSFLIRSIELLEIGGNLGFVLPTSFEYADYARPIRGHLIENFSCVDVIRSKRALFSGVQEGSIVLICRNKGTASKEIRYRVVKDIEATCDALRNLDSNNQQTKVLSSHRKKARNKFPLSDFLSLRIGAVTGDSKYFTFSEAKRKYLGLPKSACVPVVSKARQVYRPFISNNVFQQLVLSNERIWLFDPKNRDLAHPAVREYLALEMDDDGCNRNAYKIRSRQPWYRVPYPKKVDAFVSGMSDKGVWFCFNQTQKVTATNTLYTVNFTPEARRFRYEIGIALMSSHVYRQLQTRKRIYADGLTKFEPSDLSSLLIDEPKQLKKSKSTYNKLVRMVLNGYSKDARTLANAFIKSDF